MQANRGTAIVIINAQSGAISRTISVTVPQHGSNGDQIIWVGDLDFRSGRVLGLSEMPIRVSRQGVLASVFAKELNL